MDKELVCHTLEEAMSLVHILVDINRWGAYIVRDLFGDYIIRWGVPFPGEGDEEEADE